jgi:dTDP-4-amino-4,6-dideoxygalactose transaminase
MYPDSINHIMEIGKKFTNMQYENAEMIAKTLVTLPTHISIEEHDKIRICEAVKDCLTDSETVEAPKSMWN